MEKKLICTALLIGLASGVYQWGRLMSQVQDDLTVMRGDDQPREPIPAAERFARSALGRPALRVTTADAAYNESSKRWHVGGQLFDSTRDRQFTCDLRYDGLHWHCLRLTIDGDQRFTGEELQ